MAILFDLTHALHRAVLANQDQVKQYPQFASHVLLQMIKKNANTFGFSKMNPMILCQDRSSWRKKAYVEGSKDFIEYKGQTYKGDRKKDDTIPWNEIYQHYEAAMKALDDHSDMVVMGIDEAEADDVIAIACKHFSQTEKCFVISSDKDFVQLQAHNVFIFDPIQDDFRPKVDPIRYKTIHIMCAGDDNIKAIKSRTGKKTAEKMLPELDMLLQTNPDMKARFEFNRLMIDFDYIPEYVSKRILERLKHIEHDNFNGLALMKFFQVAGYQKISEDISSFRAKDDHIHTKRNSIEDLEEKVKQEAASTIEDFFS